MSAVLQKLNRRNFLKTSAAAAGGLVLGFYLPEKNQLDAQSPAGNCSISDNTGAT